ncbi:MAG: LamG domain-containing protein [Gammaproteobacteria bacterium]|nr:LamG domain-containing protein [Gammaproteobacteria bacterium]
MNEPTHLARLTNTRTTRLMQLLGASLLLATLYGCGDSVQNSPQATPQAVANCGNADECNFQDNLWAPILILQCGGCHGENGSGTGEFAHAISSMAYPEANSRIDRTTPANSFLVTKVAGGHNCWVQVAGETDCTESAARMASAINNWVNPSAPPPTSGGSGDLGSVVSRLENPSVDVAPVAEQIILGSTAGALQGDYVRWIWGPNSNPFISANQDVIAPEIPNCGRCHSENAPQAQRQQPYFADSDPLNAFNAVVETRKIDINNPENSRLYLRLAQDSHNCWSDCASNAVTMLAAIQGWKNEILSGDFTPPVVEGTETTTLTTSQGLQLDQGQVISGGSRVTAGQIALWEFKEGSGNVAQDTSGVAPQIDLVLNDETEWVGGWGIEFNPGGRATSSSITASQKLRDQIVNNNAFTIEAWVVPGNVTQEGPAIIASYSFSETERNFSMGQTLYSYEFLNRNTASGLDVPSRANGQPTLITDPNDEDLQATQQHVVLTYDATNGRRIYVNGQFTGDVDTVTGGSLSEWDAGYVFILGSDVGGANQWLGKIRMVAIYNRALTQEEITQNFDAGVGQKFHLLFKVGHLSAALPDTSYIWFEVAEFDNYSYLFANPAFIVLDPADGSSLTPTSISLNIQGMRIGVNGKLPTAGQAFLNMNRTISMPDLADTNNPRYESLIGTTTGTIDGNLTTGIPDKATGTIIAKERGPNADPADQFYLTFENFAGVTGAVSQNGEPIPLNYNYPPPVAGLANSSYITGLKLFEEINASMAELTGISITNGTVRPVFLEIQQQLPSGVAMEGFLASHQIGIAKLALTYCGELVDNTSFFGSLNTSNATNRETIVSTLYSRFIIDNVASQPSLENVRDELIGADGSGGLVADLSAAGATNSTILKSMCLAVLGSASTTVQ